MGHGVGADRAAEHAEAARGTEVAARHEHVPAGRVVEGADAAAAALGDVDLDGLTELAAAVPGVVAVALEAAVDRPRAVGGVELEGVRAAHVADDDVLDRDVRAVQKVDHIGLGGDRAGGAVGGVAVPDAAEDLDVGVAGVAGERLGAQEVPQEACRRCRWP